MPSWRSAQLKHRDVFIFTFTHLQATYYSILYIKDSERSLYLTKYHIKHDEDVLGSGGISPHILNLGLDGGDPVYPFKYICTCITEKQTKACV